MHTLRPGELTDAQLWKIAELVKSSAGINLHDGKRELIKARLTKRLRELKLPSFKAYMDYLKRDESGEEFTTMLDILSTNVTHFFREADHLSYLRDTILPRIEARDAKKGMKKLRIWSAGCSSGEEPYSIAITVSEALNRAFLYDARILATDLSTRMLTHAKQGVYPESRLRDLSGNIRLRHFECLQKKPEKIFRIQGELRKLVTFARLNLMDNWPMRGPFDAIFCRNVMIYFDKPTQERLINRFWDLLGAEGALFIGHSESLTGIEHQFKFVRPTVYEKK